MDHPYAYVVRGYSQDDGWHMRAVWDRLEPSQTTRQPHRRQSHTTTAQLVHRQEIKHEASTSRASRGARRRLQGTSVKGVYSPLRTNTSNIQPYWRPSTWRRWTPDGTNTSKP